MFQKDPDKEEEQIFDCEFFEKGGSIAMLFPYDKQSWGSPWINCVKLVFKIVVDDQTKIRDRTFEGVPDSNRPPVPTVQRR